MAKTLAGPGRLGSVKAVKQSLKGGGQPNIKNIPKEDSITVRFLDEPEDFHGYYEHWMKDGPLPCASDECDGCDSDDPEERKRQFKYLANAYVVDDQKVWALKLPKSLVEILMAFHKKYKGTLLDRDYELSRTGSGQFDTKYMAAPDDRHKMDLSRFDKKKHDLKGLLLSIINSDDYVDDDDDDDDDDEAPVKKGKKSKSGPSKKKGNPWDDDGPRKKVKKKSASVKKKSVAKKRPAVKKTVKRSR